MAVTGVAGACILTVLFWGYAEGEGTRAVLFTWLNSGTVDVSFALNFDRLAAGDGAAGSSGLCGGA